MSKINAVRLINVNYNNNAIRISDECFHFNGESTLISLRNGGGKSVLVQMMTAPFVHKRYRDAKDRPFESYFTTGKPSFIMVEWVLDQGAGYVLTGMMVRRSQDVAEENANSLDMINFITEYRKPCVQDIHHLSVVEKGKKEMTLKNFSACRQMFETYKKDRSMQFFYYDMNNSAQSRQYFDKLMEYQINYKEWESIIKKVNLKESGLSELFADCRDEKGLVEKWFLDAVESKLNKDRNRMKEFQVILEKYVGQYKENRSKIQRRDTIRAFKEEALRIQERAGVYQSADEARQAQENLVANFISELTGLRETAEEAYRENQKRLEEIRLSIARVEYEKLSGEIYALEDDLRFHTSNRDMLEIERDTLEKEAKEIENRLHLLMCAKQQESVENEKGELDVIRQKLLLSQKKDEELEPERRSLGFGLWCCYEKLSADNQENLKDNRRRYRETEEQIGELKEKTASLENQIRDTISREGALKSRVQIYDNHEEQYNGRYKAELARNILGEYEPGTLEILKETYARESEEEVRQRLRKRKQQETSLENKKRLERNRDDIRTELIKRGMEKNQLEGLRKKYDEELKARRVVLKYLNLDDKSLFDTEKILRTSESKLQEIAGMRRRLEKEEDVLQKEYQRLTRGKVLELPGEFEEELERLGIHVVYGMEWLQKNGCTEEKNLELVRRHPFLPYALILSGQEMEKLEHAKGEIYTSFPVPIVVRESLAGDGKEKQGNIISLPDVSFYVLFNENLLNEEKLRLLVQDKEQQIKKKKEAIHTRQTEYEEYFKRQELIENQEVNKELYDSNEAMLNELTGRIAGLEDNQRKNSEELAETEKDLEALEQDIREADKRIEYHKRRAEDFEQLRIYYAEYEQSRQELSVCRKEAAKLAQQQELTRSCLHKLEDLRRTLETEADVLDRRKEEFQEKLRVFSKYDIPEDLQEASGKRSAEVSGKEMDESFFHEMTEMENRYKAITGNMSLELQELEERERSAAKRYEEAMDELEHLRLKFRLEAKAWKHIRYSRKEESHQEIMLEDCRRKAENRENLWREEDKKIAVISQQRKDRLKQMKSDCGQDEPLPKSEIQDQDFEARKNQLRYQEKETQKEGDRTRNHLQGYDENLTALSEYTDFALREPAEWEQDFSEMDAAALRNFKGILIRDYNQRLRDRQQAKERLIQVLNQIVRLDAFQEDFYKKPLEAMIELSEDASQVLRQLSTTIQSYDNLMEKLEVDISMVEKEKSKIVELLEDYIKEVHQNLGKIDHNSTITIRERPVKMLKIQLPAWEENENLYQVRLQDMIDEVTLKGIEIFEKNENAQEYFGTRITTRNLYDTVVGIGNVQIRLYKIEEQREYPITWAEVAKNSGGEGFLSAFVILSSLLYYMRKDESDLFADRNEGKVLLMDNPFAQTNASHLLKPLMDMAKKTNTQLICLTGLGGESIYNRFDNIYVLNLIAASLRNGMQYLKADHLRGNEPETMVVSQIEVVEQQELVF